jgi:acetyl esterase
MMKLKVVLLRWFYRWVNRRAWSQVDLIALTSEELLIPGATGNIRARRYEGNGDSGNNVIIFLHGGGWVLGDLETHAPFCRRLATQSQTTVIALDYRLAPEHHYPAAALDCIAATQSILAQDIEHDANERRVFIAGDSAGGNLAAVVANHLSREGPSGLCGQILLYPVVRHYRPYLNSYLENAKGYGLTKSMMEWFWDTYLGAESPGEDGAVGDLVTPLFTSLSASVPPALIITAGLDPLRDEGAEYAAKLNQAGISCKHQLFNTEMHGFACSDGLTDGHVAAMRLICEWIDLQKPVS